ncbi:MAG: hypothetical protein FVQ80_08305 [Planctomycetes bacterium]|nr:hypothetical protein [Planctomycetota bacterium]
MDFTKNMKRRKRPGAVLIVSLIFVLIFSALAVSLATISANNVQIASNHHQTNAALAAAYSGLEVLRYHLAKVSISGTTAAEDRLQATTTALQSYLTAADITNVSASYNGSSMTVPAVTLNSTGNQTFTITITAISDDVMRADVTGNAYQLSRTIRTNFNITEVGNSVFDYGVATKGPLVLEGNVDFEGASVAVEASVYIESASTIEALSISGNSQIAGNVSISNPDATVTLSGNASIGGETGDDAIDNHVETGVDTADFPQPVPSYFEQYIDDVIDMNETTFENIRIPAGTNPTFSSDVILRGIIYIETPNVLRFSGSADITGIIVGDGDWNDDSATNSITFTGNVQSNPISTLPEEEKFDGIRTETGTFLMAPGFSVSFGGNFDTLNGTIAANGIEFTGNAGGTIAGSVINYSSTPMTLSGNNDLYFNRSGITEPPAGFVSSQKLTYQPESYSEI